MIELRWYYNHIHIAPKLQFRTMVNFEEIGLQNPIWSEWENVPNHFAIPDVQGVEDVNKTP